MSTLEEQVEAEQEEYDEAQASEPEPDDPDLDDDPDAEPELQAPAIAIGPDEIRKAERARDSYRKKISEVLGPEAVAHECMLCAGLGYLSDLPPFGTSFTLIEAPDGPTLDFQAPRAEPAYKSAEDKEQCPECDGWGMVLTGARADHGRVAPCSKCSGNGWVIKARTEPPVPAVGYTPAPGPQPGQYAATPNVVDAWGRAPGHPHWGVPPANIPG